MTDKNIITDGEMVDLPTRGYTSPLININYDAFMSRKDIMNMTLQTEDQMSGYARRRMMKQEQDVSPLTLPPPMIPLEIETEIDSDDNFETETIALNVYSYLKVINKETNHFTIYKLAGPLYPLELEIAKNQLNYSKYVTVDANINEKFPNKLFDITVDTDCYNKSTGFIITINNNEYETFNGLNLIAY